MTQISAQAQFERRDSVCSGCFQDEAGGGVDAAVPLHHPADGPPPQASLREDSWRHREPVLTPQRKMRFLDELSRHGNVRVAAGRVGVSRSAVYLAQRRDAAFARGWRAALVLARDHAEAVLAERAIEGVEEQIWYRGELVGARRRYDGRLLLAHLARLDRLCAEDASALEDAGRFDAVIGEVGELAEAVERDPETGEPLAWPDRADYVEHARELAAEAARSLVRHGSGRDAWTEEVCDAEAVDALVAAAEAEWDAFHLALWQAVDAALAPCGAAMAGGGDSPLDCVQGVQSIDGEAVHPPAGLTDERCRGGAPPFRAREPNGREEGFGRTTRGGPLEC